MDHVNGIKKQRAMSSPKKNKQIKVKFKHTGEIAEIVHATYYSNSLRNRVFFPWDMIPDFIGKEDPPAQMMMKIRITREDGLQYLRNCSPKDIKLIDMNASKRKGYKSIW